MADITVTTAKYGTIITAIGKQKIAAAILAGKQVKITHAAVGDGGGAYYKPTEDQTDLINECWRGEIASYAINESAPNMIDIKFVVPAEVGGFTVREGMAVDEDGDAIAIWNTPDAQKVPITEGVSFPLTMVAHILVEDASAVTIEVNPTLDTVSRDELDKALKNFAAGVGSAINTDITIPAAGWAEHGLTDAEHIDHPYAADVAVDGCTAKHFPVMALARSSLKAAGAAGMAPSADTFSGFVRFYAKRVPAADLTGTIQLRSENLNCTGGGCECPDTATDEEVKTEVIEGIFGVEDTVNE